MEEEGYSVTRGVSFVIDIHGNGSTILDIPFAVKEIKLITAIYDFSDPMGVNSQYMLWNCNYIQGSPIAITGGTYTNTINGNYGASFKYMLPTNIVGQFKINATDILGNGLTLAQETYLYLVMEFVRA